MNHSDKGKITRWTTWQWLPRRDSHTVSSSGLIQVWMNRNTSFLSSLRLMCMYKDWWSVRRLEEFPPAATCFLCMCIWLKELWPLRYRAWWFKFFYFRFAKMLPFISFFFNLLNDDDNWDRPCGCQKDNRKF